MQRNTPLRSYTGLKTYTPLRAKKRNALKRGGTYMAPELRKEIEGDPEYQICAFRDVEHPAGPCDGRVTREHAVIVAGRKVQERWAIIPCCAKHHAVDSFQDAGTLRKDMNIWVALNRATDDELLAVSKAVDYIRERARLNAQYGPWRRPLPVF